MSDFLTRVNVIHVFPGDLIFKCYNAYTNVVQYSSFTEDEGYLTATIGTSKSI